MKKIADARQGKIMLRQLTSIRTRIVLLVLLAALPAAFLMVVNNSRHRNQARLAFQENVMNLTGLAKSNQLSIFDSTHQMLTTLSKVPELLSSPDVCSQVLRDLQREFPSYASISLSDADGRIKCSSAPFEPEITVSDRSYFVRVMETGEFAVGDYAIDRLVQIPVLPFAQPVRTAGQEINGVLIANLDLAWQHEQAATINLPEGAVFLLVDSKGSILTRVPGGADYAGQLFSDAPIIRSIMESQGEGIRETKGVDGIERLYGFSPLWPDQTNSIHVSIGIPTDLAYAEINRASISNLLTLAVVTGLAVSLAFGLSNRFILQKVDGLLVAAKQLERGNLGARARLSNGNTELDQLGQAFNAMAAGLEQREIQLRRADVRYRLLVEQMPAVTYTLSVEDPPRITYVSPQVDDMLGFSAQEWVLNPENWSHHLFAEDSEAVFIQWQTAIRERQPFQIEYRMLSKQGALLWVRDEARPVHDETGETLFFQGIWVDITPQKRLEETLREYSERLERSNRELQDFAYIASHDLQEPLRKIQAFGERLESKYHDRLGDEGQDYLSRMRNGAARLQNLINDLLAYSRVTTKTQPFRPVDLNKVMSEVTDTLEQRSAETQGKIEISPLPVILADSLQMQLLFQNLIGNALKFHREGVPPVVKVYAQLEPRTSLTGKKMVRIIVEDNGIGFDEKYLDRIFQPFQRLHGRDAYEGSGIGSAISRKIVDRHQGTLSAASRLGEGSRFVVTLPQ